MDITLDTDIDSLLSSSDPIELLEENQMIPMSWPEPVQMPPIPVSSLNIHGELFSKEFACSAICVHTGPARAAGEDSRLFYQKGVNALQAALNSDMALHGAPQLGTLIGITVLMVYEMLTGNQEDEAWLDVIKTVQMPQIAPKTVLLMRAVRIIFRRRMLIASNFCDHGAPELEFPDNDYKEGMQILEHLRSIRRTLTSGGWPVEVHTTSGQVLNSPFLPVLAMESDFVSSSYPFLLAMLLTMEEVLMLDTRDKAGLISQLVQISQHFAFNSSSSAELLHQCGH
ncbi:hypothetical protein MRB53_039161 [Persea americana]|nr:hypothetical protein MRB53_039161 [Persea americana]